MSTTLHLSPLFRGDNLPNTLKCMGMDDDPRNNEVVVAGILTPDFAVIDQATGGVTKTLHAPGGSYNDFTYRRVLCSPKFHQVLVTQWDPSSTGCQLLLYMPDGSTATKNLDTNVGDVEVHGDSGRYYALRRPAQSTGKSYVEVYGKDLSLLDTLTFSFDPESILVDDVLDRLLVSYVASDNTLRVAAYGPLPGSLEPLGEFIVPDWTGYGTLVYDPRNHRLLALSAYHGRLMKLDGTPVGVRVDFHPPMADALPHGDTILALATTDVPPCSAVHCYSTQTGESLWDAEVRYEAKVLSIDHGSTPPRLYVLNNGDASVSVLNAETGLLIRSYKAGSSIEALKYQTGGKLVIIDRLGGSNLYSVTIDPLQAQKFDGGAWPTGVALDGTTAIVFDHLESTVRLVNLGTGTTVSVAMDILPSTTDALSEMAYDPTNGVVWAVVPEHWQVGTVDVEQGDAGPGLDIPDKPSAEPSGPGLLQVASHGAQDRAFIYNREASRVYVTTASGPVNWAFDLPDDWQPRDHGFQANLISVYGRKLYVGPYIYDASSLMPLGKLTAGDVVVGYDPTVPGHLYTAEGVSDGQTHTVLRRLSADGKTVEHSWALRVQPHIPPVFTFDFKSKKAYIGYMQTVEVDVVSLA